MRALLLTVFVFGCAGAPAPRPSEPAAEPAPARGQMRIEFQLLSPVAPLMWDDDDAYRVLLRGRRIEASDEAIREADVFMHADVGYVHRLPERWLFLSFDGSLARADGFLGAPERIGGPLAPAIQIASPPGSRRLAVRGLDGPLLTSAGEALRPLGSLADVGTMAAFASADVGVVVTVGGAAGLTTDGGGRFALLDLEGPVARMFVDGERVLLELGPTDYRPSEVGPLIAVDAGGALTPLSEAPDEVRAALQGRGSERADRRAQRLVEAEEREREAPRVHNGYADQLGIEGLEGCHQSAEWETGLLVRCDRGELRFAPGRGASLREVPGVTLDGGGGLQPFLSDDGVLAALGEHCGPEPEDRREDAVCVFDTRDGSVHELPIARGERTVALNERALVLARSRDFATHFRIVDHAGEERALPAPLEAITGFDISGNTVSVVAGPRAWAAPLGGEWAEIELPEGTSAFAMADPRHGIAAGPRLETLFVTRDGGATFERIAVPVIGEPAAAPAVAEGSGYLLELEVDCTPEGCAVVLPDYALSVTIEGFGEQITGETLFAGGPVAALRPRRPRPREVRTECVLQGRPDDDTRPFDDEPPEGRTTLSGALGEAVVRVASGRVEWSAGRWRSRSAPGELPIARRLHVALVERDLAIFAMCARSCALVRARPGEAPVVLDAGIDALVRAVVGRASEDGIAVGVEASGGVLYGFWLDRRGEIVGQRRMMATPMIVEHEGALAFVARDWDRAYAMTSSAELSPDRVDAPLRSIEACSGADPGPVWAVLTTSSGSFSMPTGLYSEGAFRVMLHREGERVCASVAESASSSPGVLRPEGGSLSGRVRTHVGPRPMRCTLSERAD